MLLHERTRMRVVFEKYRRKVEKGIGFGIFPGDTSKPFECAVWVEGAWEPSEELEKAIENEPPFVPAPDAKIPGRNQPCICGSGRKFKKCCLEKINRSKGELNPPSASV